MKLAVFDFDGTLMKADSLPFLLKIWGSLGYPRYKQWLMYVRIGGLYIRYKLGLNGRMSKETMKKTAFQKFTRIFSGMNKQQIHGFFKDAALRIMPELNEQVISEIEKVKRQGFHTVLLSGFYHELLELIAQQTGIESVLGTKMHYNGVQVDAKKKMTIRTGQDKVERILEEFADADYEQSCAYADSISDLGLLEMVGTPVAVCPDSGLRQIAADRGWRVME